MSETDGLTKLYYTEVGEYNDNNDMDTYFEDITTKIGPDGLYWGQRGGLTESFPEAEARGIILSKTYKHVRIAFRQVGVVGYVED